MSDPVAEVLGFFREWEQSYESMLASVEKRFLPTTIWENVGLATTTGFDQAKALLDGFKAAYHYVRAEVIVRHIAAVGNVVLTERIDRFIDAGGNVVIDIPLMGILEMDGPRILHWRDYFDTVPFVPKG